ncbi:MAG: hypothetical protein ACRDUX_15160 [Mycobacterium sp.]
MSDSSVRDDAVYGVVDEEAAGALREILTDPALPVAALVSDLPTVDGVHIAALREALDYVTSRRIAAGVTESVDAASALDAGLSRVDPALAATLRWHGVLGPVLAALPPTRSRNAVLGDVHRGDLLTWAPTVRSWTWVSGSAPGAEAPIGRAEAEIEVDDFPGLYDAILVWEPTVAAVVVVPTHRDRVSWEPAAAAGRWVVRLAKATVHADELIALDSVPHQLAS